MTKFDFFIFEIAILVANIITAELKNIFPEDFKDYLFFSIIDHVIIFTKKNCSECHISCLYDPLEKDFICYKCVTNSKVKCPYDDDRKEFKKDKAGFTSSA